MKAAPIIAAPGVRVLDVCSGYSASTLGWHGLGFRHVGYAEIDAFPRAILEQRHGATPVGWDHRYVAGSNVTPLFGDFTKIEEHHVGPVDLLTGGTPCQSFSVAGKRLGLDDPRGNLTLEFLALARRLRVPWLAWENVPGFLSHDDGRTMGTFLGLLGELGYGWAYRVLDAQYVRVDGCEGAVPQRRRRVFVVGHLGDAAGPAAVLFERESLRGDPAPRREAGEGVAGTLESRASGGGGGLGAGTDGACAGYLRPIRTGFGGGNRSGSIDAAACLTARGHKCDFEVETFVMQAGVTRENPDSGPDGVGVQQGAAYCLEARAETQIVAQVASTLSAGSNSTGGDRQPGTSAETAATMLVAHPVAASLTRGAESAGKGGYAGRRQEDDVNLVAHALRAEGFDASEDGTGRGTPLVPVMQPFVLMERGRADGPTLETRQDGTANAILTPNGGRGGMGVGAVAYATNADCFDRSGEGAGGTAGERAGLGVQEGIGYSLRSKRPDAVAFAQNSRDEVRMLGGDGAIVGALGAEPGMKQQSYVAEPDAEQWAVRRLTPTECERLMDVPDGFTAITYRNKPAADGPRYRALGNSQARNVMRWIGRGLADVIAATSPASCIGIAPLGGGR